MSHPEFWRQSRFGMTLFGWVIVSTPRFRFILIGFIRLHQRKIGIFKRPCCDGASLAAIFEAYFALPSFQLGLRPKRLISSAQHDKNGFALGSARYKIKFRHFEIKLKRE